MRGATWILAALAAVSCRSAGPDADEVLGMVWAHPDAPAPAPYSEPVDPDRIWTLDAILARIARANPDLAAARARVAAAEAARREAERAWIPVLTAGQSYLSTDNPSTAFALRLDQHRISLGPGFDPTPGVTERWRTELRVDLALFEPGRGERTDAASAEARAARLAATAVERRLLNAGVQAWAGLRAAQAMARVTERSVRLVEERLRQTRERAAAGAALEADVLRLEARLANARQRAQQAALAVRHASSALQALMGLHGQVPLRLADEPDVRIAAGLPRDRAAAIAHARAHRLDLRALAERMIARGHELAAARSGYLPRLIAFGAYDLDGRDLRFDTDLDSYTAGVALEWRLSATTAPRIDRARAARQQARARLAGAVTAVSREVADALAALATAEHNVELARAARRAAEEAFRIMAARQDAGAATVTDVLEAETARDQAAVGEVAAEAELVAARARFAASVGEVR